MATLLVRREPFSVTDGHVRVWRRRGQDPFQDNVVAETEMFGGGSIMVWGCFSHNHKLGLKVVGQTLTGQRYIDDILEPIVYPLFRAHQAARPIFQDYSARPHTVRMVSDSLAQEGIENLQCRAEQEPSHRTRLGPYGT